MTYYDLLDRTPAAHWSARRIVPDYYFVKLDPLPPTGIWAHRLDASPPARGPELLLDLALARFVQQHPDKVEQMAFALRQAAGREARRRRRWQAQSWQRR